jgi:VanZ family protein
LGEYIPFGFLAARACRIQWRNWKGAKLLGVAVLASLLYGAGDEFHQSFVPGRSVSPFDVMADTLGGLIGAWLFLKIKSSAPKGE